MHTAVPGATMRLTLDAEIQDRTEEILEQVGRDFSPKGASAIVMDPTDGSVLAMANWPRIDANDLSKTPAAALQNRAVGFTHEPGSTFKAFTVAAALEEGEVGPETRVQSAADDPGRYDRVIGESHPRGWATLTTREILAHSSNVGAIKIGQRLKAQALRPVGAALRLRQADGNRAARRGAGAWRSTSRTTRARRSGNLPIGQGELRDADPDGGRLLGDRQRRDPAHPADRR